MMTLMELKNNLEVLVKKYISDALLRNTLLEEIRQDVHPSVKRILNEINKSQVPFDPADSDLITDIAFNYL